VPFLQQRGLYCLGAWVRVAMVFFILGLWPVFVCYGGAGQCHGALSWFNVLAITLGQALVVVPPGLLGIYASCCLVLPLWLLLLFGFRRLHALAVPKAW